MTEIKSSIVYLLDDKLGGIISMNSNLMRYCDKESLLHHAVLLDRKEDNATRFARDTGADTQVTFRYSLHENMHFVLRRLYDTIPHGLGVLVSNNILELQMLEVHNVDRTVVQIVHDEWNLDLALRYEAVVDVFVAHSKYYFDKLRKAFPLRHDSIFYLPYGITLSPNVRQAVSGPLRLIFVGRMHISKGIFDLPIIDRLLHDARIETMWTIVGDGPEKQNLQTQWGIAPHVKYVTPDTTQEVLALCAESDVLVFPTRFEGFPVALLEAMSAGVVPVVSDLPSGVPEVVSTETGFRLPIGDCAAFADAIAEIDRDRERLELMSHACRYTVESNFDIRQRVKDYENLFARYQEFKRPQKEKGAPAFRSRLDNPHIPNALVIALRKTRSIISDRSTSKGKK